eukprot:753370-Hanusia_phi.AAC.5
MSILLRGGLGTYDVLAYYRKCELQYYRFVYPGGPRKEGGVRVATHTSALKYGGVHVADR